MNYHTRYRRPQVGEIELYVRVGAVADDQGNAATKVLFGKRRGCVRVIGEYNLRMRELSQDGYRQDETETYSESHSHLPKLK